LHKSLAMWEPHPTRSQEYHTVISLHSCVGYFAYVSTIIILLGQVNYSASDISSDILCLIAKQFCHFIQPTFFLQLVCNQYLLLSVHQLF
jgi:hypothetical protein